MTAKGRASDEPLAGTTSRPAWGENMKIRLSWALAIAALTIGTVCQHQAHAASSESVLWSFGGAGDGFDPHTGVLMDAHGNLYGTTAGGGAAGVFGHGTVFELNPPGAGATQWNERVLWSFAGSPDGNSPWSELIEDSRGNLYGTTTGGGLGSGAGYGVVFELTPPAAGETQWDEQVLYRFSGGADGYSPTDGLLMDRSGDLYGAASVGGVGGHGVVYELTPPGRGATDWSERVLYSFSGGVDGDLPRGPLVFDRNGNLYGVTEQGGVGYGDAGHGVVFQLTPPFLPAGKWRENVLWRFTGGADGALPFKGVIVDRRGNLYGTTNGGGIGNGVVYQLSPPAPWQSRWSESVLWDFKGAPDGAGAYAGVTADDHGNLYGTTYLGGKAYDSGTVFELSPPGHGETQWSEQVLWSFEGATIDGAYPEGNLILDRNGTIYGTTLEGGENDGGTVFKVTH
jgi:uncharacterized repeat protein (TIGR03803 family)